MAEKKAAVIRDWVEPAHPMVVKYHDDLISIYKNLRDQYLDKIDQIFDRVSREIGFLITTTLPLTIEFAEQGKIKSIALGSENLKGTLFEKQFTPLLKEMSGKESGFSSSISPGTYDIHLIWFSALKLKFRTDWMEPAHFNDYIKIRERFSNLLRFDWVEPAHVALGIGSFTAVDPNVMEPVHLMPSQELWRDKVLIAAIDQVYPEFRLIERVGKLKELLRANVRPEVTEPAHFSHIKRELPREALAEIDAILARYGYK